MFSTIDIAGSGLSVQRLNMDVIANNVVAAGSEVTRTPEGGPFRRSRVIVRPIVRQPYWRSPFIPRSLHNGVGRGVRAVKIEKDMSNPVFRYDPTHPDRIMNGLRKDYVEMPNVNLANEMINLVVASRAYEASATLVENSKSAFMKTLEIMR